MDISKYILPFLFVTIISCKSTPTPSSHPINRSIYYWKSIVKISNSEKEQLSKLNINTIYLKFFDVEWNGSTRSAMPLAQVRINDQGYLSKKQLIPTVFITNECIQKIDSAQVPALAHKIYGLIKDISTTNHFDHIKEIQIDCDWTSGTKNNYFALLDHIQREDTSMLVSATIRLHQVKFFDKTGIPPVRKGMLMCYNMGNLKDPKANNSIIELQELEKYITGLNSYPLQLDVALPIFEWNILLRKGQFVGLMESLPDSILSSSLFKKNSNRYEVLADSVVHGYPLQKGDVMRNEKSDHDVVVACGKMISSRLQPGSLNVSLYHLDSLTLSKYSLYELENIYNSLR